LLNIPFLKTTESSSSLINILITQTCIRENYTHSYVENKLKLIIRIERKAKAELKSWFYRYSRSLSPATSFLLAMQLSYCGLKHHETVVKQVKVYNIIYLYHVSSSCKFAV